MVEGPGLYHQGAVLEHPDRGLHREVLRAVRLGRRVGLVEVPDRERHLVLPHDLGASLEEVDPLEESTVEDFLSHRWAAQIRMDERLEDYKLTWEVSSWNDTVSKSRNPNKNAFM